MHDGRFHVFYRRNSSNFGRHLEVTKSFNNETARKQSLGCESYIRNFAESYLDLAKTDRDAKILSEDEPAKSGSKAAYSFKLKKLTRCRNTLGEKI